jgi:DNA-binding transcriptional regulator YiaG
VTPAEAKLARRQLGLSVDGLARVLKTTGRSVRRWEDGTREVPGPADVLLTLLMNHRVVQRLLGLLPHDPHTPASFEG